MTEPNPTYQAIDFDAWHKQMEDAGWQLQRDIFGNPIQYTRERPKGRSLVVNAAYFAMWAGLRQTPPPF
jgi:hypothetical protein